MSAIIFSIIACSRTEERIAEASRRFEDGGVGGKSRLREQRRLGAVARCVAGVKRFDHGALLAMDAAGGGGGDAEGRRDFLRRELQEARAGDRCAETAEYRRAVKTAVLNIRRVGGDFTDDFDAQHIGFEQFFARGAEVFAETERGAEQHAARMPDVNKCVPVVEVQRVGE